MAKNKGGTFLALIPITVCCYFIYQKVNEWHLAGRGDDISTLAIISVGLFAVVSWLGDMKVGAAVGLVAAAALPHVAPWLFNIL